MWTCGLWVPLDKDAPARVLLRSVDAKLVKTSQPVCLVEVCHPGAACKASARLRFGFGSMPVNRAASKRATPGLSRHFCLAKNSSLPWKAYCVCTSSGVQLTVIVCLLLRASFASPQRPLQCAVSPA
ncbi:unnamed protein product [Symbiodinium sp. CCMP2456]|nr:unnamed protein product [Symbiodinium sp. CCMP2456]